MSRMDLDALPKMTGFLFALRALVTVEYGACEGMHGGGQKEEEGRGVHSWITRGSTNQLGGGDRRVLSSDELEGGGGDIAGWGGP